jgi:CBS domain-containing protein
MTSIRQILAHKPQVYSVRPSTCVFEALQMMEQKNVGALLVMEGERLAGIFSERDYARRMILQGRTSRDTPVSEVMTPDVFVITPDANAGECMVHMTERKVRHLPVVEAGRVVGVISIGDVVRAVIDDLRFSISQLENYIQAGG